MYSSISLLFIWVDFIYESSVTGADSQHTEAHKIVCEFHPLCFLFRHHSPFFSVWAYIAQNGRSGRIVDIYRLLLLRYKM